MNNVAIELNSMIPLTKVVRSSTISKWLKMVAELPSTGGNKKNVITRLKTPNQATLKKRLLLKVS